MHVDSVAWTPLCVSEKLNNNNREKKLIKQVWYPLLWLSLLCCTMLGAITVQWSFTALKRGREWDRRQLTPPLLLLPAEWGVLHFLRAMQRTRKKKKKRLTSVKVTIERIIAAVCKPQRACGGQRHWEGHRETDGHDRERDRWAAAFSVMRLLSNVLQLHAITGQQWEWIIFTPRKIAPTSFSHMAWLFWGTCLFVRCFRVTALDSWGVLIWNTALWWSFMQHVV